MCYNKKVSGKFLTFHGIDGVGKTTMVDQTVASLAADGQPVISWNNYAEKYGFIFPSKRGDFAASVEKKRLESRAILGALSSGLTIVKDRWYIDVLASHTFAGDAQSIDPEGILKPDLSVILVCDEKVRMNDRILVRANPTPEDLIPNSAGTRAGFFEDYLLNRIAGLSRKHLIIDTTNITPTDVSETVRKNV